LILILLKLVWT